MKGKLWLVTLSKREMIEGTQKHLVTDSLSTYTFPLFPDFLHECVQVPHIISFLVKKLPVHVPAPAHLQKENF